MLGKDRGGECEVRGSRRGRRGCVKRDHVRGLVRGNVPLVNSKL